MARLTKTQQREKRLQELKTKTPAITVQLDHRTTITLNNRKQFNKWKQLFPDAIIIDK